ncbi:MAG: exodeoxyribonuclease III [Puniceicoccales bacterium]|jgi:exodeoxyribonuclease-3|nr:exodeoxyribonuclease III [Puniceicoccales bacterium]
MTTPALKLYSWNVNGYRSIVSKTLNSFLLEHSPDILCLQEIKATMPPSGDLSLPYPFQFFHSADKAGYSGTALLSRVKPIRVSTDFDDANGEHPREGRVISAEFAACHVVCAYVPNARHELARLDYRLRWDDGFRRHLARLASQKPVFVCGDLNCAHQEIDLTNPSQNRYSAGFSDEERASFSSLLANGFVDTFRAKNPEARECYSWWSYRAKARERNVGWRIDYWLADQRLDGRWQEPRIHIDITGSDHCPVSVLGDVTLFA